MDMIVLFVILAFFTLLERYSFLVFLGNWEMPPLMLKALRYAPATILFAISAPGILRSEGVIDLSLNPKTLAGIVSIIVAWRTRSILYTITAGMFVFWLSHYLMGLSLA